MKGLPLYRYSVKNGGLQVISPEVWNESGGSIVVYDEESRLRNRGELTHDLNTRLLEFRGSRVETAAPTVLSTAISPNGQYAAVISAEGKFKRGGIMPFGDPVISGRRFHQVFRMADAVPVGEPVMLQGTTERNDVEPCWSPDGRYVVYQDGKCEHLWIIEAPRVVVEDDKK
jgi:dipeptidyl aminopeptidase/acylaminoacyl peptidase